jgi:hypothetical protein
MKTYLYFLMLLISSNIIGQELIIDKNKRHFESDNSSDFFECKKLEYQFEEGVAVVKYIDNDTIYIKNESNTGSSGTHISFKIDKKLNVYDLKYYIWDDVEDGSTIDFSVQEFKIILNKNPFEDGIKRLKGFYNLKIKSDFDPGEMLSGEHVKPKTEIFQYKAGFECIKNF